MRADRQTDWEWKLEREREREGASELSVTVPIKVCYQQAWQAKAVATSNKYKDEFLKLCKKAAESETRVADRGRAEGKGCQGVWVEKGRRSVEYEAAELRANLHKEIGWRQRPMPNVLCQRVYASVCANICVSVWGNMCVSVCASECSVARQIWNSKCSLLTSRQKIKNIYKFISHMYASVCACVYAFKCVCVFAQQLFPFIRQPFVANSGQCLHRETERERYRKSEPESKA